MVHLPRHLAQWDLTDELDPQCLEDRNDGLAMSDEGWYGKGDF